MRYAGVIEGFYGKPWTGPQREQLFAWLDEWDGMNTYLYAPKDDLKHRKLWREQYTSEELQLLGLLIDSAGTRDVEFIYAISPGLDIRYSDDQDAETLLRKLDQVVELGCRRFAVLFDDIPSELSDADRQLYGTFAAAQAEAANMVLGYLSNLGLEKRLLFCPTVYCDRMADFQVGECEYLLELGEKLKPGIDIFWTGPEVVSPEIPVESIVELRSVIQRKPVIWDNIHANDYDLHRMFVGPYSGRPLELKNEVEGILSNPNCELWANYIPLKSLAMFCGAEITWNPREAYLGLVPEWLDCFGENSLSADEIELLGDCFYLPAELGKRAIDLLQAIGDPQAKEKMTGFSRTVHSMYEKIADISNRDVFHSLHRFFWELRRSARMIDRIVSGEASTLEETVLLGYLPGTREGGYISGIFRRVAEADK